MWADTPGMVYIIFTYHTAPLTAIQDYTHWIKADSGVQSEVMEQLMKVANINELAEWQKYVAVCFDEVKVKEGIVYDKHDCRVVGFVDFGEVNNALSEFERSLDGSSPALAKQMMVFMVRGVFFRLSFPYAQFATRDLSAEVLFPMVLIMHNLSPARTCCVFHFFERCGVSYEVLSVLASK
jgi:hypothetical protein